MNNHWVFRRTDNVLEHLVRHNIVINIRINSKDDADESEEVGQSIWNKEAVGLVVVAVNVVGAKDGSVGMVTDIVLGSWTCSVESVLT